MSTTVYIVLAEHGEYSDRDVWAAGAFTSHEAAKAYVLAASERRRLSSGWFVRLGGRRE